MNENKEIMAKNIKHYMSVLDVNATEICKDLGIKQNTFSDWVNAKTYPRIDKIEMMANYFGVSKADLVEAPKQSHFSGHPFVKIRKELNYERPVITGHFVSVNEREYVVLQKYREADDVGKEMVHRALNVDISNIKEIIHETEQLKIELKHVQKNAEQAKQQILQTQHRLHAPAGFSRKKVIKRRQNGIS